jgi:hypothetical protein
MTRVGTALVAGLVSVAGAFLVVAATAAGASEPPWAPATTPFPAPCLHPSSVPPIAAGAVSSLEKEVTAFVGPSFSGIGSCGNGLVVLTLTPGSEATAQKVRTKFGPSIQIMVGFTVWNGRPGRSPRCGSLPAGAGPPPGFTATLHLDSRTVVSGQNLRGEVVFHNVSGGTMRLDSAEPLDVEIVRPSSSRVVGIFGGAVAGVGLGASLAPGTRYPVSIAGGTARCDGGLGSALPPGRYDAVALVGGAGVSGPVNSGLTYVSSAVPVQVVAR